MPGVVRAWRSTMAQPPAATVRQASSPARVREIQPPASGSGAS